MIYEGSKIKNIYWSKLLYLGKKNRIVKKNSKKVLYFNFYFVNPYMASYASILKTIKIYMISYAYNNWWWVCKYAKNKKLNNIRYNLHGN